MAGLRPERDGIMRSGRVKITACAFLVWVVTVAGVIGGGVPPVEASTPQAASSSSSSGAGGAVVESLARARFGQSNTAGVAAIGVGALETVSPVESLALARGVAGAGVAPLASVADAAPALDTVAANGLVPAELGVIGLVPADLIDVERDPSEFDEVEQQLLDRVKEASKETVKRPGFDVWPGFDQLQLVGLGTWFRVDDDAWVEDVEVSQELAFEELIAVGNPYRVQYEFANNEVRFCERQGVAYSESATRADSCWRGWEHTSEVEPQRVRARLVYRFEWELHEDTGGGVRQVTASGDYLLTGDWSDWRDLTIGELGTVATDGTSASQVRPDRGDGVETMEYVSDRPDCGWNVFCHAGRAAVAIWQWTAEKWNDLSSGLFTVANMLFNVGKGCFSNIVDVFLTLKDMITKVAALVNDPVAFIREQIEVVTTMISALQEDPLGVAGDMLAGAAELELWNSGPEGKAQWIGKFGCQLVAALFTGGGALAARFGGMRKMLDTINDFMSSRGRRGNISESELPGNRRDNDERRDDDDGEDGTDLALCRKNNSFPAGTEVRMASGALVPIEEIRPGDWVVAGDPMSGQWSPERVLDQWSHADDGGLVTAVLTDGSVITATDHHEFWVDSQGAWLELEDVQPGDTLLTPDGVTTVFAVATHPAAETVVWDLDIAGPDTFTVHTGTTDVLVHNCEFDERADELVTDVRNHPEVGRDRTAGGGSGSVNGQDLEYQSSSGRHQVDGLVDAPDDPVFNPSTTPQNRALDAEYKIMEQAAADIDELLFPGQPRPAPGAVIPEAEGIIRIVVDSPPGEICQSCQDVIAEFRERYPNVDIEVRDVVGGTP